MEFSHIFFLLRPHTHGHADASLDFGLKKLSNIAFLHRLSLPCLAFPWNCSCFIPHAVLPCCFSTFSAHIKNSSCFVRTGKYNGQTRLCKPQSFPKQALKTLLSAYQLFAVALSLADGLPQCQQAGAVASPLLLHAYDAPSCKNTFVLLPFLNLALRCNTSYCYSTFICSVFASCCKQEQGLHQHEVIGCAVQPHLPP